jgi:hypothetical protein
MVSRAGVFVVALLLWVAFGVALLFGYQSELHVAHRALQEAPPILEVLGWVLLLPWVAALAVWESSWDLWLRATAIVSLAWLSLYILFPWKTP